ncbi:MAG: IPT/TIG domain-containing protein [Acidobacteriota bacterium]
MGIFEGKSPTEKKKIIAAGVLCAVSLIALYLAFGRSLFGSSTKVVVTVSPTPKSSATPKTNGGDLQMPTQGEQNFDYQTTEVVYNPGSYSAPDAGRNIFAFYEPPPPCPTCPTPIPPPLPEKTPVPTPTPWFDVKFVNPQSVYAGSKGFRLDISGDKFTRDARIYFSQNEVPTTFVSEQRLVADIPANFIAQEGPRQIIIQTPDGKKYSSQVMLNVQPPPKPEVQYIGMIARKRYNNDTAYFLETGKQVPISARLNDLVGGRFKVVSISAEQAILEDVNLGFRHPLPIFRPAPGTAASQPTGRDSFNPSGGGGFVPYNPNPNPPQQSIPGISDSIPRYVPPPNANPNNQMQPPQPQQHQQALPPKKDQDDDDDGDN